MAHKASERSLQIGEGFSVFIVPSSMNSIVLAGAMQSRPCITAISTGKVVINEFLNQMNGIREDAIIFTATNDPKWIDPAILHAGRIEHHFALSPPDKSTQAKIRRFHLDDALSRESLPMVADDLEGKSAASLEEIASSEERYMN